MDMNMPCTRTHYDYTTTSRDARSCAVRCTLCGSVPVLLCCVCAVCVCVRCARARLSVALCAAPIQLQCYATTYYDEPSI
eukprot:scaffold3777_cov123-Isochrysis_galbana.AAC.2